MVVDWPVAAMMAPSRCGTWTVARGLERCGVTAPTSGSILPECKDSPRRRKPRCEPWVRLKRSHLPSDRATPCLARYIYYHRKKTYACDICTNDPSFGAPPWGRPCVETTIEVARRVSSGDHAMAKTGWST